MFCGEITFQDITRINKNNAALINEKEVFFSIWFINQIIKIIKVPTEAIVSVYPTIKNGLPESITKIWVNERAVFPKKTIKTPRKALLTSIPLNLKIPYVPIIKNVVDIDNQIKSDNNDAFKCKKIGTDTSKDWP